jgi:hypothetical protein
VIAPRRGVVGRERAGTGRPILRRSDPCRFLVKRAVIRCRGGAWRVDVQLAERQSRRGIASFGGSSEPGGRLADVALDPITVAVGVGEFVLGEGVALLCRHAIPAGRLSQILRHRLADAVLVAQRELGRLVALRGGLSVPMHGRRHVVPHPAADVVQVGEGVLSAGMALNGRQTIGACRLGEIALDDLAFLVDLAQPELRVAVALVRQGVKLLEFGALMRRPVAGDLRQRGQGQGNDENSRPNQIEKFVPHPCLLLVRR